MARWLTDRGHAVRVVTAPPYYPDWKVWPAFAGLRFATANEGGARGRRRCAALPAVCAGPAHGAEAPAASGELFAVVVGGRAGAVALEAGTGGPGGAHPVLRPPDPAAGEAERGQVRDARAGLRGGCPVRPFDREGLPGVVKRFAYAMERTLLRAFDRVSTISSGMLQRARPKGVAEGKLRCLPNWSETARFRDVVRSPVLLRQLGVDPDKRVLLYSGNIGLIGNLGKAWRR
ncbi:glycosyltransferase [Aromatoleum bremense]|nr:glycosyltransferase [Aromatoleum bremense]